MKSMFAVAFAALLFAAPASAQTRKKAESQVDQTQQAIKGTGTYGLAGCGLGSMAFGDSPGAVQIFAATTNGLFGTQTFGITTGTSNCGPGLFAMGTKNFVEANREALAKDISRGEGDAIGALTVINRCGDSAKVGAALQRNFAGIFPSEAATNDDVTKVILDTLHGDAALGCGRG
jgi:hypothetical protein